MTGLFVVSRKKESLESKLVDCSHAHHAWLKCGVNFALAFVFKEKILDPSDCKHLRVIEIGRFAFDQIVGTSNDLSLMDDHRSNWEIILR